jgi:hypothetical protein
VACRAEHGPHNKVLAVELWFLPKGQATIPAEANSPRVGRAPRGSLAAARAAIKAATGAGGGPCPVCNQESAAD